MIKSFQQYFNINEDAAADAEQKTLSLSTPIKTQAATVNDLETKIKTLSIQLSTAKAALDKAKADAIKSGADPATINAIDVINPAAKI